MTADVLDFVVEPVEIRGRVPCVGEHLVLGIDSGGGPAIALTLSSHPDRQLVFSMHGPLTQDQVSVIEQGVRLLGALPAAMFTHRSDRDIEVRVDTGESDALSWSRSTARREPQFHLSHAVRHYALIAMIGRMRHRPVDEDCGMAPSTLKHRRRAGAACAQ